MAAFHDLGLRTPETGFFPCSRHANQGGQTKENTMTILSIALLISALAQLVSAVAKLLDAFRHRR
jgi:hypothetical protein